MRKAILVPDLGDSKPVLNLWLADLGERVYAGDRVAELLLVEATFDVSAPITGRLADKMVCPGELLRPGQVLGHVEEEIGG